MTILQFMDSLRAWFGGDSWHAWRVVLSAIFGLPIKVEDIPLYQQLTGTAHWQKTAVS